MGILVPIAFALTFIILVLIFNTKALLKRKIRKIKLKNIADVIDGETVRIKGRIVFHGKTLTAPISGRTCSYYHVILTRHRGKNKHTLIDKEISGDVIIQDGKDIAVISTFNSKSLIHLDKKYSSGFLQNPSEELLKFLQNHSVKSENLLGMNKTLDYSEGILEKDELVVVAGQAHWVNKNYFSYNLPCERVLLIKSKTNGKPIYFSDVNEIVHQR